MLMVDELTTINAETANTSFLIKKDCIFVKNNKLSEAGLIENAAQTCSAISGQFFFDNDDLDGKSNKIVGFISAIKKTEIKTLPSVNDEIITKSILITRFEADDYSICTMDCKTYNKEVNIANFTMNLFIQEVK